MIIPTVLRTLRQAFVVGYIHGRSSADDHSAAGRDAEEAFAQWFDEIGQQRLSETLNIHNGDKP